MFWLKLHDLVWLLNIDMQKKELKNGIIDSMRERSKTMPLHVPVGVD